MADGDHLLMKIGIDCTRRDIMTDSAGSADVVAPAPGIMNAQGQGATSEIDAQIRALAIDGEPPRPQRQVFVASHAEAIHIPPGRQTHMIPIAADGPQFPLS